MYHFIVQVVEDRREFTHLDDALTFAYSHFVHSIEVIQSSYTVYNVSQIKDFIPREYW